MLLKLPPPHPFAFPLSPISLLAFASSFLPPVFISIFLNFLGYARGKYIVLQPRLYKLPRVRHSIRSLTFSRSEFSVPFPFCSQYFLLILLLWLCLFSMLSLLLFLQLLHGLQSYKGVLFPVGLPARKTAIPRAAYIVLTVPLYLSGCNSLVSTFPSDGSGFKWYIRWLRFFSNLIERSSGIAVSCFSVLAVYSVSYFLMRGFQFFRFIYMPFLLYAL